MYKRSELLIYNPAEINKYLPNNPKDFHLKTGMKLTGKRLKIMENMMNISASIVTKEAFPGAENPGTRVEIMVPCSFEAL